MAIDDITPETGPPSQPGPDYTVGATGLVSRTFNLWIRRIGAYLVIVGLVGAVLAIINSAIAFAIAPTDPQGFLNLIGSNPLDILFQIFMWTGVTDALLLVISILLTVVGFVINAITYGAAIKLCLTDYGDPGAGTIGDSFSYAISRLGVLIGAQLLYGFIILLPVLPGAFLFVLAIPAVDPLDPATYSSLLTASVLILVGGIITLYLVVRLLPTIAVVVAEEDKSVVDSLKKAWNISEGNFFHILVGFILFAIVVGIASIVIAGVFLPLALVSPLLVGLGTIVAGLIISPLPAIFQAVLYRDLESRTRSSKAEWW